MLAARNATDILLQYEQGTGRIVAVSFQIEIKGAKYAFRLPLKWRDAQSVLQKQGVKRALHDEEYVYRVAWRILRDWVHVQMALYDLQMAQLAEIFLPYMLIKNGKTFYDAVKENPKLLYEPFGTN